MRITHAHCLDNDQHLAIVSGKANKEDVRSAVKEVAEISHSRIFVDICELDCCGSVNSIEAENLADTFTEAIKAGEVKNRRKLAILTSTPNQYGLSRVFTANSEIYVGKEIQIHAFSSREEAEEWLGTETV